MSVLELAKILAPDCSVRFTGIRPGEKLHEVLVSPEEARHTIELPDRYVILPENPSWRISEHWKGDALPEQFSFNSDQNSLRLTPQQLLDCLESGTGTWHHPPESDQDETQDVDTLQPAVD